MDCARGLISIAGAALCACAVKVRSWHLHVGWSEEAAQPYSRMPGDICRFRCDCKEDLTPPTNRGNLTQSLMEKRHRMNTTEMVKERSAPTALPAGRMHMPD